ncbi:MAG: hypothetical protein GX444_07000 [Myxococcales bacterium]|nr:hypothetical protein [Myxococcales bacterium]
MHFDIMRVLRTPHSERFVLQREGRDAAGVDLHYLVGGVVAGTVSIFHDAGIGDNDVPAVLAFIDESLLPEASIAEGNIHFTVIIGNVLGSFSAEAPAGQ